MEGVISKGSEMEEAMAYLRKFSKEEQFRILEEAQEKNQRNQMAREDYVFDKGKEEGIKKGWMEIIFTMIQEKADPSFISKVTGLSETEIQKLSNKIKK